MPAPRTTAHEKVVHFESGDDVRDRFDTSALSLSNSMIRTPHKHHCLLLAGSSEARMREFDSRLASRCLLSIETSKLIRYVGDEIGTLFAPFVPTSLHFPAHFAFHIFS